MHMFIKKIEFLAVCYKPSNVEDLIYLFNNYTLDLGKINRKVLASQWDAALEKHGNIARVAEILGSLDIKWYGSVLTEVHLSNEVLYYEQHSGLIQFLKI